LTRPRRLGAKSQGVSWDEETKTRIDSLFVKMYPFVRETESRNLKQSEVIRLAANVGLDVMERTALDENGHWRRNEGQVVIDSLKTGKFPKEEVRKAVMAIKIPLKKHLNPDERELRRRLEVKDK